MIGFLGEIIYRSILEGKSKFLDLKDIDINPRERTDEVDVFWK